MKFSALVPFPQTLAPSISHSFAVLQHADSLLKFRRVAIRGAQPSARLPEEICLSEGSAGFSPRVLRGLCGVSAVFCGGPRDFPSVFGGSDPMLVALGNCWTNPSPYYLPSFRSSAIRRFTELGTRSIRNAKGVADEHHTSMICIVEQQSIEEGSHPVTEAKDARPSSFLQDAQPTLCTKIATLVVCWAHSERHPHSEGTFTGTLVSVGDLRRNSGACQGGSCECGVVGLSKFAKLRQASPKFAWSCAYASGVPWNLAELKTFRKQKRVYRVTGNYYILNFWKEC